MAGASEIASLPAHALVRAYRDRQLSPVEVAQAVLDRIDRVNPRANAFAWVDPGTTLTMARESEQRWMEDRPLGSGDGIPTSVKDLMLVRGWPTLRGSLTTDPGQLSAIDSPCVARLREAGAVFVGKTTVPEFGWKGVNDSPRHGPTGNPWDSKLTSGGSSGGAAVAAALGLGAWHTASDAAGSIRIPAAFCGVFGLKPTHGLVPLHPPGAFTGLAHHGPITRTAQDAAAMMSIMCRPDPRDASAVPSPTGDFTSGLDDGIKGLRIGYARSFAEFDIAPEIADRVEAAVAELARLGAAVDEISLDLSGARAAIETMWTVGCAALVEEVPEDRRDLLDPGLVECAARGTGIGVSAYRASLIESELFASRLNLLHCRYDLLVMATVPIGPFPLGHDMPPSGDSACWRDWTPLTYPFNLSHQPAASVPCGFTERGVPASVQIVGRRFADATVLRAAHAYEVAAADNAGTGKFPPLPT